MGENQAAVAVLLDMDAKFPVIGTLELSERQEVDGKKQNVKVGELPVFYPTLESFGITAEHDAEAEAKRKPSDQFPIYSDLRFQWLQTAINQKVEAFARSKTSEGKLKDGASIAECFADLTEVGERGGQHLKNKADCLRSFQAYFSTLETVPKAPVIAMYVSFMQSPESLLGSSDKAFSSFTGHLATWSSKLDDESKARFSKVMEKVAEAVELKAEM